MTAQIINLSAHRHHRFEDLWDEYIEAEHQHCLAITALRRDPSPDNKARYLQTMTRLKELQTLLSRNDCAG